MEKQFILYIITNSTEKDFLKTSFDISFLAEILLLENPEKVIKISGCMSLKNFFLVTL